MTGILGRYQVKFEEIRGRCREDVADPDERGKMLRFRMGISPAHHVRFRHCGKLGRLGGDVNLQCSAISVNGAKATVRSSRKPTYGLFVIYEKRH